MKENISSPQPETLPRRDFLQAALLAAGIAAILPFSAQSQTKTMNKYGLFGKLQAQAGKGAELAAILLQAAKLMENAKGCILYVVSQKAGNTDAVYIYEVWESQTDHDNSLNVAGVSELIKRALPIFAEKPAGGVILDIFGGCGI